MDRDAIPNGDFQTNCNEISKSSQEKRTQVLALPIKPADQVSNLNFNNKYPIKKHHFRTSSKRRWFNPSCLVLATELFRTPLNRHLFTSLDCFTWNGDCAKKLRLKLCKAANRRSDWSDHEAIPFGRRWCVTSSRVFYGWVAFSLVRRF